MSPSSINSRAPGPSLSSLPFSIGYVIKMFPRLSETFILNEVLELEEQGLPLRIFSLKRPVDKVLHAQAVRVRSPIVYLPETILRAPLAILQGQLNTWRRHPRSWRHILRNTCRRARSGDLLAFCQACCITQHLDGIRHLHAHYANVPAKVALVVQRLTGATYSISTHAKDIFQNDPFASPKLRERMWRASFIVANSRFSAEHIRQGLNAQADIRVVHNGLDLSVFPYRRLAPAGGIAADTGAGLGLPLILGVGRLVEKKGFTEFVSMCRSLKDRGVPFRAKIVGTGVLTPALKTQIRALNVGDRITLAGPMPHQLLRELYAQAAVFVLPCKLAADGDRDILPNALKEAMAVGVPVVTTRLDGIEELIQDGVSGLLVEPGDAVGLSAKVQSLLEDPALACRLSASARLVIEERFDRKKNFALLRAALAEAARPLAITEAADPLAIGDAA